MSLYSGLYKSPRLQLGESLRTAMMNDQKSHMLSAGDYEGLVVPVCGDFTGSISTPWLNSTVISPSLCAAVRLHLELRAFLKYISASPVEAQARNDAFRRLASVLSIIRPQAILSLTGSTRLSLALPASDIDVVLTETSANLSSYQDATQFQQQSAISTIEYALNRLQSRPYTTTSILRASVPVLKIREARTGLELDLTYRTRVQPAASDPVAVAAEWQSKLDVRENSARMLSDLVMVVKHVLGMRRLGTTYTGGINSYVLFWMVVAWLELEFPALCAERGEELYLPRGVDGGRRPNLGIMLREFFRFYGEKFDYQNKMIKFVPNVQYVWKSMSTAASPFSGGSRLRLSATEQRYLLAIEDPASGTDPGRKVYGIKHVKETFKELGKALETAMTSRVARGAGSLLAGVLGGNYSLFQEKRRKMVH
ncbi:hypothetical protein BDZ91DRAFT_724183 [Kalaharituber pfeilii]|nr:hypothetical protein BDZ91DRAFT_724183 [Kalaharituber pfeilii]